MREIRFMVMNPRTATDLAIIGAAKEAMKGAKAFDLPVSVVLQWNLHYTKTDRHLPLAIYERARAVCQSLIGENFVISKAWQIYELRCYKNIAFDNEEEHLIITIEAR